MRWWPSVTSAILILLGCATVSHDIMPPEADSLPPSFKIENARDRQSLDYFLLKMADANPTQSVRWWVEYRRASLWQDQDRRFACEKFTGLAMTPKFPLHQVALARARQSCAGVSGVGALPPRPAHPDGHWLNRLEVEADLAEARAEKNRPRQIDLLLEKSKWSRILEEKIQFIEEALTLARAAEDKVRIQQCLDRRSKLAPRFLDEPGREDWLNVANDFRRARQWPEAVRYYQKVAEHKRSPLNVKVSALKGLAQTFKTQRLTAEYLATLERIFKITKPGHKVSVERLKTHFEATTTLARALWTEGQVSRARGLLEDRARFFARHKRKISRAEIFWILGRMQEEEKNWVQAIEYFRQAESELGQDPELTEKVMWYLAWNLHKTERWSEAVTAFATGRDRAINEFSRARFQYWLAKSLRDGVKDETAAIAQYEELIALDPLGYYGLLAHRDLGRPIRRPTNATKPPPSPSRIHDVLDPVLFAWLIAVEETDLAREVLDQTTEQLRRQPTSPADEATWTDLMRAYAQAGSYQELYERLGRMPAASRQAILANYPELLFPQPFQDSVKAAANQFDIPAELLFAIMRQESSFNPRARSPADAFGLMQLLPEVAAASAQATRIQFTKPEDLYIPEVNIPLGAHHIRQLWDRFNGRFILAVASYNASERAIRTWLKLRYHGDPVAFIEDVPYEETRAYIRLVMRNLIFYQVLSTADPVPFPDWVFKL